MKRLILVIVIILICMPHVLKAETKSSNYQSGVFKAVVSIYDRNRPTEVKGTGFAIDENGTIVTCYHEIIMMESPYVYIRKKNKDYNVRGIKAYDSKRDICIIKIDAGQLDYLNINEPSGIHTGEDVFVPSDISGKIFPGILSGFNESFWDYRLLVIDIGGLKSGDSGAPILDASGNLVGMILMARVTGSRMFLLGQKESVGGFAIGINEIKEVYEKILPILTLEKFKELNQSDSYYFLKLAGFYAGRAKYDIAISNALKAITLKKENIGAYTMLGDCYQNSGDLHKAIEYYGRAIDIQPTYLGAIYGLAGTYMIMKNFDMAILYYKKCIELQPDTYEFYWGLGYSYASKEKYNEAKEAYIKAAEFKPNSPEIYQSLGTMYLKLSNLEMAKESLQKAVELYRKQEQINEAQKLEQYISAL